jgi:hypothetical protein
MKIRRDHFFGMSLVNSPATYPHLKDDLLSAVERLGAAGASGIGIGCD